MNNNNRKINSFRRSMALLFTCLCGLTLASCKGGSEAKNRSTDIDILYTGDIHCAVENNIGFAGLKALKGDLIDSGNKVITVDSGDAIQGGIFGSFYKGKSVIDVMNDVGYDCMTLGNHEFDYTGPDQVKELSKVANFPFLSCNFTDKSTGETLYDSTKIIDIDGTRVGFIGITTPYTISDGTPTYFQDSNGNYLYDFMADGTGDKLVSTIMDQVDYLKHKGTSYIFALSHLGSTEDNSPYSSREIISRTTGIDAFLDGHSHSTIESEVLKNKVGNDVILTSTGTQFENVGLVTIKKDKTISSTLISSYDKKDSLIASKIKDYEDSYSTYMSEKVGNVTDTLYIKDPVSGVRIVRNKETNLGDFVADAYLNSGKSDIAFINGGGIRSNINKGDVTRMDLFTVNPFSNTLAKVKATGQQILDALELSSSYVTEEFGGFLQVAGMSYEIDTSVKSTVELDNNGAFVKVAGDRRVKNVLVNNIAIDATKSYSLTSIGYIIKDCGNGYTMFKDDEELPMDYTLDSDSLIDYFSSSYEANKSRYTNPYGEGRIVIK